MTERLYDADPYLAEFDFLVVNCEKAGQYYEIIPDRSAFYPEGGGQSGDRGILYYASKGENRYSEKSVEPCLAEASSEIHVLDTQERGGKIILLCDGEIPAGTIMHGIIDWKYRFDRMQNHTGEHIVSGLIHQIYGYHNTGFHMSDDRVTIDIDGLIPEEGLCEIERMANEAVWKSIPVRTDVYSEAEAERVEFRSKKELHGIIRVVTIPGADVCACCGTHVRSTGEIGLIRLISHERFKGGLRIEMTCGRWAYTYDSVMLGQNKQVSVQLSSRPETTAKAVAKLLADSADMKNRIIGMLYEKIDRTAEEMRDKGNLLLFADGWSPALVQKLTAKVMETCGGCVFTFTGSDEEGYRYAAGEKDGDLKELIREMNVSLNGKGGGRPYFLQGSVTASREETESYLRHKIVYLSIFDVL